MSYDLHIGSKSNNEFRLALDESIHSSLFHFLSGKNLSLPYLRRLEDYYQDSSFTFNELPRLILELNQLADDSKLSEKIMLWLNQFEKLAIEAIKNKAEIFGFCD